MPEPPENELTDHLTGRSLTSSEAAAIATGTSLIDMAPSVQRLTVHEPNKQNVTFKTNLETDALEMLMVNAGTTELTAYFAICSVDPDARKLLFPEMPQKYTWGVKDGDKAWVRRKRGGFETVGRMHAALVTNSEHYHLRMLLNHVRGPTSFEDLRTVEGELCPTFRAAAARMGLLKDDLEWDAALAEASDWMMAFEMRKMFSTLLLHCHPTEPKELWDRHRGALTDDLCLAARRAVLLAKAPDAPDPPDPYPPNDSIEHAALRHVERLLKAQGKSLADFPAMEVPPPEDPDAPVFGGLAGRKNAPAHKYMGGLLVVFGGDFQQVPPVVEHGTRADIVAASLKGDAQMWAAVHKLTLSENMRARAMTGRDATEQREWAAYLLRIGSGTEETHPDVAPDAVRLPDAMVGPADRDGLLLKTFGPVESAREAGNPVFESAGILTPLNADVNDFNARATKMYLTATEPRDYFSADTATSTDNPAEDDGFSAVVSSVEILNTIEPVNIPPHILTLKVCDANGCPPQLATFPYIPRPMAHFGPPPPLAPSARPLLHSPRLAGGHAGYGHPKHQRRARPGQRHALHRAKSGRPHHPHPHRQRPPQGRAPPVAPHRAHLHGERGEFEASHLAILTPMAFDPPSFTP